MGCERRSSCGATLCGLACHGQYGPRLDPDYETGVVMDHAGRTSHAAIVSRELGFPAIVGCGIATDVLHDQQEVTVDCAQGDQ
ncbi:PEP-utilizing enzyme [Thioclava indica]|uniref:PEP-utilizing enzyme n=1 Tax=Thioclava indica TaxID=1353528 RepID=UPI001F0AEE48|nr:PEP-utilizing enzyme [Thioclava indica]